LKTGGPLFDAVMYGDEAPFAKIDEKMLALRDEHHRSLLFCAVLEGRTKLVERFIAAGAAVNPKGPKDRAPLIAAAMRNRPKETKILLAAGADPSKAIDKDGHPCIVTAAFRENIDVVRALLRVEIPPADKSLALLEAAGVGHLPIVELLVAHGADPEWVSSRGNSALSIARKKRRSAIVAYFKSL
jgi:ankyrin repeat protein